jgi:excisionase family DNA binding protein
METDRIVTHREAAKIVGLSLPQIGRLIRRGIIHSRLVEADRFGCGRSVGGNVRKVSTSDLERYLQSFPAGEARRQRRWYKPRKPPKVPRPRASTTLEGSEWMSLKEAGKILGLSPTMTRRLAARGIVPTGMDASGIRHVRRDQFSAYVAAGAPRPALSHRERKAEGLRPKEASAALGVSRRVVGDLIASGRLEASKVGSGWYITPESLDELKRNYPSTALD